VQQQQQQHVGLVIVIVVGGRRTRCRAVLVAAWHGVGVVRVVGGGVWGATG
jgi:hypothetical protein